MVWIDAWGGSLMWSADMDGFKLLEMVGLEMDLPVISRCLGCLAVCLGSRMTQVSITLRPLRPACSDVQQRRDKHSAAWCNTRRRRLPHQASAHRGAAQRMAARHPAEKRPGGHGARATWETAGTRQQCKQAMIAQLSFCIVLYAAGQGVRQR